MRVTGATLTAALAAWLVLGAVPPAVAAPTELVISGVRYSIDSADPDAGATVVGNTGLTGHLTLPNTIDVGGESYPVRHIGANSFYDTTLTSVHIPDSVITVADQAFNSPQTARRLTSVHIGANVERIGAYAFSGNAFAALSLPAGLTSIGTSAFQGNQGVIPSLTIPGSVTNIGSSAFRSSGLASLTLEDGVSTIGGYAFAENSLDSVVVPDSVTSIGGYAFFRNRVMETAVLPSGLETIESQVFAGNWALTSVTIPDGVTTIGNSAFLETALPSVVIPDSVTIIHQAAFRQVPLTSLTLGDGVTFIDAQAFQNNQLSALTLPEGVEYVGAFAFSNGDTLTEVRFRGLKPDVATSAFTGSTPTAVYPWRFGTEAGVIGGYPAENWTLGTNTLPTAAVATVTFDTGELPPPPAQEVLILNGNTVAEPSAPTMVGRAFTGWFTADLGGLEWDFAAPVTGDLRLHAQWLALEYTVTLHPENGDPVITGTFAHGDVICVVPVRAGHTFLGWFTARTGGADVTSSPVTGPLTLYAHWAADAVPGSDPAPPSESAASEPAETAPAKPALAGTGASVGVELSVGMLAMLLGGVAVCQARRGRTMRPA